MRLCVFVKDVYEKFLKRSNIIRRLIIVIIRVLNNIISSIFNKILKRLNYFYQRQCDKNNHFYLTPYFVYFYIHTDGHTKPSLKEIIINFYIIY